MSLEGWNELVLHLGSSRTESCLWRGAAPVPEPPVEALHVGEHALPVRLLELHHVVHVKEWIDVRQLPGIKVSIWWILGRYLLSLGKSQSEVVSSILGIQCVPVKVFCMKKINP